MAALKFDNMKIQSNDNKLEITMNDESILSFVPIANPDVYIKYEIKGTKAYIYMKTKVPINSYTFVTNEPIKFKGQSQINNGEHTFVLAWSNYHNPNVGKIAGFTVFNLFDKSEYDLFMILDNVTSNFKFEGEQEINDNNGKSLLYHIE
uniref:Uncharacterized protein n=1 Tax=viral metagenome TaxID=1070528 RepID=A0A6C0F7S7_9ZZZZ|tara:strand:- start:4985 stop:5431 length:447 start_codon:yes stop_codon:yes gene_type:complete